MEKFNPISQKLFDKLQGIKPNQDDYRPCMVILKNGKQQDFVYFLNLQTFIKTWGYHPREDKSKRTIEVSSVADIQESPSRLPDEIVEKLNKAGETRMGAVIAKYVFSDGSTESLINAHDFIEYPQNKTATDLKDVIPHKWDDDKLKEGPDFYYCIYENVEN